MSYKKEVSELHIEYPEEVTITGVCPYCGEDMAMMVEVEGAKGIIDIECDECGKVSTANLDKAEFI